MIVVIGLQITTLLVTSDGLSFLILVVISDIYPKGEIWKLSSHWEAVSVISTYSALVWRHVRISDHTKESLYGKSYNALFNYKNNPIICRFLNI